MPRLTRLDAPGIMHHVMIRGIEGTVLEAGLKVMSPYEMSSGIRGTRRTSLSNGKERVP